MLAALGLALVLFRPTDLTFVRHAETLANSTGHYNSRTIDTFSDLGKSQVVLLTKKLSGSPRFDRILVSPSPRALRTIAPYLKATGQKAMIWPLLYECCTGKRPKGAHATSFKFGSRVRVPADLASLFVVDSSMDRFPVASDYNSGLAQVADCVAVFHARFEGGRVLLVGHSGQGGQLIHALTRKYKAVLNATPMRFELGQHASN